MKQTVFAKPLSGTIESIPSKSWAHRRLIAAALAKPDEASLVRYSVSSEDIDATLRVLEALGAKVEKLPGVGAKVYGLDRGELARRKDSPVLDCGESGTTLRYMLPVAAALDCPAGIVFTGSGRLPQRPQEPLAGVLRAHGALLAYPEDALLPVKITGRLKPGRYEIAGNISSQFLGGLLYALSILEGESELAVTEGFESEPYVRMTLELLAESGAAIDERRQEDGLPLWTVTGAGALRAQPDAQVEGDWSNAAFWLSAGAIGRNAEGVSLTHLNPKSLQGDRAILEILKRFGARVEVEGGTVSVRPSSGGLKSQTINARQIPDLVPILAVVAAAASGTTVFTHAERLRIKESDRLKSTSALLTLLGVDHDELPDGLVVRGLGSAEHFQGGEISSFRDHRIVMAAAVAAASAKSGTAIAIEGAEAAAKSYPRFFEDFVRLGGKTASD